MCIQYPAYLFLKSSSATPAQISIVYTSNIFKKRTKFVFRFFLTKTFKQWSFVSRTMLVSAYLFPGRWVFKEQQRHSGSCDPRFLSRRSLQQQLKSPLLAIFFLNQGGFSPLIHIDHLTLFQVFFLFCDVVLPGIVCYGPMDKSLTAVFNKLSLV